MARRLFGTKPLSKLMLTYSQLDPQDRFQWHFNPNSDIFIHENALENVTYEMEAIFTRGGGGGERDELIINHIS